MRIPDPASLFRVRRDPIVRPGLHHFRPGGENGGRRVHLRVEADGSALLVIDASRVIHLNSSAADMAWLLLSGTPRGKALDILGGRYRVSRRTAAADYDAMRGTMDSLLQDNDICPISFLGLERIEPFATPVTAPYRADLALTYRCNNDCSHCYNWEKESPELDTMSWKTILGKLWDNGIPHVAFTGGEATLREDLPDLVSHAESLGMVSGLLTNGVKASSVEYTELLRDRGLDYAQVTLESSSRAVHDSMTRAVSHGDTVKGLINFIAAGIYTITNTTITEANRDTLEDTLRFGASLGLRSMAFNSVIRSGRSASGEFGLTVSELEEILPRLRSVAIPLGVRLVWYTPTRYCELDPVSLGLGPKRCTAAQYNICIEPDGGVIPCQSCDKVAGNILKDDWTAIFGGEVFRSIRERDWVGGECRSCEFFALCGGGCPLEAEGSPVLCPDSMSNP